MHFSDYVSSLSFRFLQPDDSRGRDGRFRLTKPTGEQVRLLDLPYEPVDLLNTRLAEPGERLKPVLRDVCEVPRMSTFAVAAIMNHAVSSMPKEHVFLNVGVWNGFSFLSGLAGNDDRTCIGVDNFSESGGPRDAFMGRFERSAGPIHRFHEMDYRDYFAEVHEEPIGVYFYDGEHSYENQWRGLEIAEPYFTDDCIVLVDDTNWADAHRATLDFIEASGLRYSLYMDERTAGNGHPTLWNGLMVAQLGGKGDGVGSDSTDDTVPRRRQGERPSEPPPPDDLGETAGTTPLVSIVVVDERGDAAGLDATIDSALKQTWREVEVIAISPLAQESLDDRSGAARFVPAGGDVGEAIGSAIEQSGGSFVSFADVHRPLRRTAVEIALGFPAFARFWQNPHQSEYEEKERLLQASEDLTGAIASGSRFAVVDGGLGLPTTFPNDGRVLFTQAGAEPSDDASAIRELEQLRASGVTQLAFLWPAFRWFERYSGFTGELRSSARCVLENERVAVFDLQ